MSNRNHVWKRREFIKASAAAGLAAVSVPGLAGGRERSAGRKSRVALIRTDDRGAGIRALLDAVSPPSPAGRKVLLKPNFNTADPPPGCTHNDTLSGLVRELKRRGAEAVVVGERSGPPVTGQVLLDRGIPALAEEAGFSVLDFETLAPEEWVKQEPPGSHWPEGFSIPRAVADAEYVAATCNLKTHQYGGVFTMSLKLAVGLTPKSLMRQLHRSPDMRRMIAEINLAYRPAFVVMDGIEAFVDGGPMTGKQVTAGLMIAGEDRVAVDAVGLAMLKHLGSNPDIMERKIYDQEQIRRAVEIGLGAPGPDFIEIVPVDAASRDTASRLGDILALG